MVYVSHPQTAQSPEARPRDVWSSEVHSFRHSSAIAWSSIPWQQCRNVTCLSRSFQSAFRSANGKQHMRVAVYFHTMEKQWTEDPGIKPWPTTFILAWLSETIHDIILIKCLLFQCTACIQLQGWMSWSYLCAVSKDSIDVWASFSHLYGKTFFKCCLQVSCWRWEKQIQLTTHLLKSLCTMWAV